MSRGQYPIRVGALVARPLGHWILKDIKAALEILSLTIQTALINEHKLNA